MRATFPFFLVVLAIACGPISVQQQVGFARTDIRVAKSRGVVGEIVKFDLRPPVSSGTEWDLEAFNRVRFAGKEPSSNLFWVAEHDPVHLETIIAPWDSETPGDQRKDTGWLWYSLRDAGEREPLKQALPITREPYKELAPVTFVSAHSSAERNPRLWITRTAQRNEVWFKTTTDVGAPFLPKVRAALIETVGKKILYAEIRVNFGIARNETISYETTLSYPPTVTGPVEVIVVEWVGHGESFGPFQVHRITVPG